MLSEDDYFASFIPPEQQAPKGKIVRKSVISGMYFFNCKSTTAVIIRKVVKGLAWVYTLAGTSTPAQISDSEMKTFMLLCDVSNGTLEYHFPDSKIHNADFTEGREAKVINGCFCGKVGVINKLPNNKYKVVMSFTSISAKVTAEIPIDFLRFL